MDIDPAILNKVRGLSNVGPDSIHHVHHLPPPTVVAQREGSHDDLPTSPEQDKPPIDLYETPSTNRISSLFRTAITAARGHKKEHHDSPPS